MTRTALLLATSLIALPACGSGDDDKSLFDCNDQEEECTCRNLNAGWCENYATEIQGKLERCQEQGGTHELGRCPTEDVGAICDSEEEYSSTHYYYEWYDGSRPGFPSLDFVQRPTVPGNKGGCIPEATY